MTDKEIIILCMEPASRHKGFNYLMDAYQQRLYSVIRRMVLHHDDTADILQNTFIKAWQGLDNFRQDSRLYTWLYRIATNEAITYINRSKRNSWVDIDESYQAQSMSGDTLVTEGALIREKLDRAVEILPDKQRAVFVLRYFEEMPYEEMSGILETSVGALKASYHHAVKKVEEYLLKD